MVRWWKLSNMCWIFFTYRSLGKLYDPSWRTDFSLIGSRINVGLGRWFQPDKYKEVDSSTRSVYALPDIMGKKTFRICVPFLFRNFICCVYLRFFFNSRASNEGLLYVYIYIPGLSGVLFFLLLWFGPKILGSCHQKRDIDIKKRTPENTSQLEWWKCLIYNMSYPPHLSWLTHLCSSDAPTIESVQSSAQVKGMLHTHSVSYVKTTYHKCIGGLPTQAKTYLSHYSHMPYLISNWSIVWENLEAAIALLWLESWGLIDTIIPEALFSFWSITSIGLARVLKPQLH